MPYCIARATGDYLYHARLYLYKTYGLETIGVYGMVSGYQNFQVSLESTLMRGKRYSSKPFRINRIQNILHETFQKVLYGLRKFEILSSKNESGVPLVGVYIYTGEPAGWKRK